MDLCPGKATRAPERDPHGDQGKAGGAGAGRRCSVWIRAWRGRCRESLPAAGGEMRVHGADRELASSSAAVRLRREPELRRRKERENSASLTGRKSSSLKIRI